MYLKCLFLMTVVPLNLCVCVCVSGQSVQNVQTVRLFVFHVVLPAHLI